MKVRTESVLASKRWERSCSDLPQQRVAELGRTWLRLLHGQVLGSGEFSGACAFGAGENSARPTLHERSGWQRSIHVHPCARPLDADLSLVRSSFERVLFRTSCRI